MVCCCFLGRGEACRTPNVANENFSEDERNRVVYVDDFTKANGDWHHKKDGGDVIEKRREHPNKYTQ